MQGMKFYSSIKYDSVNKSYYYDILYIYVDDIFAENLVLHGCLIKKQLNTGDVIKTRLDGTSLYLTNDGTNP